MATNKRSETPGGPPKGGGLPEIDGLVTRHQIFEMMAYEGYSADQRQEWLKSALTHAGKRHEEAPSEETAAVIEELESLMRDDIVEGEEAPRARPGDKERS